MIAPLVFVALAWAPGCGPSGPSTLPPLSTQNGGGGSAPSGGDGVGGDVIVTRTGPPDPSEEGYCGNTIHPYVTKAPNLYFVFDASGSMAEIEDGQTRYASVRRSAVELVRSLGPFINVGAAVFPLGGGAGDTCRPGGEVYSVHPGDAIGQSDGPTTLGFAAATLASPSGGTPTAATLRALLPRLSIVAGKTSVLLLSDGGPNCNYDATCAASECIPNIEGICAVSNCCARDSAGSQGNCLDTSAAVGAIAALRDAGITTYVIGIPGSEAYGSVLGAMAEAGGAARPTDPAYYRVDELGQLEGVLGAIASTVVSCEFTLDGAPPDPDKTNVYLDKTVLPGDPVDGWVWIGDQTIALVGEACDRLKNGAIKQVQIVSGCPTEPPR